MTRPDRRTPMQGSHPEDPRPLEPSRRRPPRAPSADAIPIPEAADRARPRGAAVQEVLAAHQRAVDARIEEGLREIRLAVAEAVSGAVGDPVEPRPVEAPPPPPPADVFRGLLAHTEERIQGLSLRLRRIEDVLRSIAGREGPEVEEQIEVLRRSVTSIAATEQREFARLAQVQRETAARLARDHRAVADALAKHQRSTAAALARQQRTAVEDLGKRIGAGIAAIARRLQHDLQERQDALLERYLRGLASELRRHQERRAARPAPDPRPAEPSREEHPHLAVPGSSPPGERPVPRPAPTEERRRPAEPERPEPQAAPAAEDRPEPRVPAVDRPESGPAGRTEPRVASAEDLHGRAEGRADDRDRIRPAPRQYLIERKRPAGQERVPEDTASLEGWPRLD